MENYHNSVFIEPKESCWEKVKHIIIDHLGAFEAQMGNALDKTEDKMQHMEAD